MHIAGILSRWPDLWQQLDQAITTERAIRAFVRLADTHAPSLTSRHTRGPVIREMLEEEPAYRSGLIRYENNLWGTGTVALETGSAVRKHIWLMTHLDTISYLVHRKEGARFRLIPLCYHQIKEGRRQARALTYSPATAAMEICAAGDIVSEASGEHVYFETDVAVLPLGARIVYHSEARVNRETLALEGNIDNAFACAAAFLATVCLAALRESNKHAIPELLAVFPDDEEGVTANGNQAFCKGSARLFNRAPSEAVPNLVLVSDVQEGKDMSDGPGATGTRVGEGATFTAASSRGKGAVVPPPLLSFQEDLSGFLSPKGIYLKPNPDGYSSRSDDVSVMMYTPNVALIGFLGTDRHFDQGIPRAHLEDLMHLAKIMVVYTLVAQDDSWRAQYLR
ncbi:MAG: hypothetical protein H0W08_02680 [Acidobacteria bacterium]|nr:hypothetical protein [Acidobacteriota bacterium]